jgi:hypothetical protein
VPIAGYFALWRDASITVYDDRFEILDYHMSIGMNHKFYEGNQTLGRIKDRLRSSFGLKFTNLSGTTVDMNPDGFFLFVRYTGDFPFKDLDGLAAVLRNDDTFFDQMPGRHTYNRDKQIFTGSFGLPNVPKNDESLRIDFYLSSEYDEPIATLKVGELKKHKK